MNPARFFLSLIAGAAASLIAFSAVYVRGNLGGVFQFLHARSVAKKLVAHGASAEEITQAKAHALAIAQTFADPNLATRLIPLELGVGLLAAALVWRLFGQRVARAEAGQERPDVQERMVLRFAHRSGGRFTLRDLAERSPLSAEQAREVVARMQEQGQLRREGESWMMDDR